MNSLLGDLRDKVFSGRPPVEFTIANEPWGSFAYRPGEVIAIAAPPGMGKTAFVTQATVDALRLHPNASCLTVNVEMSPEMLLERQVSRLSGVPLDDIIRHTGFEGRTHLIDSAFATLESIGDRLGFMGPPFSIEHVVEAVRVMQPRILVLDYIQRLHCCDGVADTRIRLNSIMHEARVIATAGVSVVLVSAVARTPSKKGGGYNANELGLGSFRESSEVEYGADDAFVIVEEGRADPMTGCRTLVMRHPKSRNHRRQDVRMGFDGSIQRFSLLADQGDGNGDMPFSAEVVSPADMRRANGGAIGLPPPSNALHDLLYFDGDDEQDPAR
ncbi:MAG: DnaB-like helicase C-terminal domain-containing protein [Planctomycetia bacterium]